MKTNLTLCGFLLLFGCAGEESPPHTTSSPDSASVSAASTSLPTVLTLSYEQRQGKQLYDKYCAVCHGDQGAGDGFNAFNLDPRPRSLADSSYMTALSDPALAQVIALGGRGVNRSVLMPAYRYTFNENQISYLVSYVRTFSQRQ